MKHRPLKKISEPERWMRYKDTDYFVSDQGRAKRVFKNGRESEVGWYRGRGTNPQVMVKIYRDEIPMKTMVYETFVGTLPEGYCIAHRNGLKRDNSLYNLIAISSTNLGKRTGRLSRSQKVIDVSTGKIYRSAREAGRKTFCSYQMVNDICNNKRKKPSLDLYWWDEEEGRAYRGRYESLSSD